MLDFGEGMNSSTYYLVLLVVLSKFISSLLLFTYQTLFFSVRYLSDNLNKLKNDCSRTIGEKKKAS